MRSKELIKQVRRGQPARIVVNGVVQETRRQYERIILEPAKNDRDIFDRLEQIRELGIKAVIASRNPKTEILVPFGAGDKAKRILIRNHFILAHV